MPLHYPTPFRSDLCACILALLTSSAARGTHAQVVGSAILARDLAQGFTILSGPAGNILIKHTSTESLVIGPQDPALLSRLRELIAAGRIAAPRFVVATDERDAALDGDGGWTLRSATTIAHEALRSRIAEQLKSPERSRNSLSIPAIGFSEVVQVSGAGSEAHILHQHAGYSDADAVVHFEGEHVVYLGNDYNSEGYPDIKVGSGGSVNDIIVTLEYFLSNFRGDTATWYVPGHGQATKRETLHDYGLMLVRIRNRVRAAIDSGRTEEAVVASRPSHDFDARWGHGAVSANQFVELVYRSLKKP